MAACAFGCLGAREFKFGFRINRTTRQKKKPRNFFIIIVIKK